MGSCSLLSARLASPLCNPADFRLSLHSWEENHMPNTCHAPFDPAWQLWLQSYPHQNIIFTEALESHTIKPQCFKKAPLWGNQWKGLFTSLIPQSPGVSRHTQRMWREPQNSVWALALWAASHLTESIRVTHTDPRTRHAIIPTPFLAPTATFSRQQWVKRTIFQKQKDITTHCSKLHSFLSSIKILISWAKTSLAFPLPLLPFSAQIMISLLTIW